MRPRWSLTDKWHVSTLWKSSPVRGQPFLRVSRWCLRRQISHWGGCILTGNLGSGISELFNFYLDGNFVVLELKHDSHEGWILVEQANYVPKDWNPLNRRLFSTGFINELEKTVSFLFLECHIQNQLYFISQIMIFLSLHVSN